ncbi:hypothetical protein H4CHR_02929 [Variovorax sp. PBS-H4]|uniref:hypothetical protein n=1 Tax=Variovorax sp. PBS-H4 TaxID=434008 RepID=UPI001315B962|nr:hypothetical protein [Variovorax sp. PBS-H4]VTU32036.1 hypothetical protein H4CHR_02929 [Variovorax sp. PBS-H4]
MTTSPTGRRIRNEPNLQQIPINSTEAEMVKKAFRTWLFEVVSEIGSELGGEVNPYDAWSIFRDGIQPKEAAEKLRNPR